MLMECLAQVGDPVVFQHKKLQNEPNVVGFLGRQRNEL
jgi:hypothetical protein